MRKAVLLFTLVAASGCSGSLAKVHKKAYIGGAVSKNVVEESHKVWSEQLNVRADECEKSSKSTAEFDECLGQFVHNDDVVIALATYNQIAGILFKVLANPDSPKEQILDVLGRVLQSAEALLALMPDGDGKDKLGTLLGK